MDITVINTIIDYMDYAAWLVVILGVIVSAILFATGRLREGSKKFTYIMVAAFVLAFGFTVLENALGYPVQYNIPGYQYISYLAYAGAAVSVIATAIYLVKGDLKEAGTYFVAAVLIIWAVNFAPALFCTASTSSSSFGTIILSANPTSGNAPLTFTLQGYVIPAPSQSESVYVYAVNEQTGQQFGMAGGTVGTNGQFCIKESIGSPGQYEIVAYIPNTNIQGSTAVDITSTPNFGWNFVAAGMYAIEQFFSGLASGVLKIFNLPFAYAVMMPTYPTSNGNCFGIGQTIYQMYQYTEGIAFGVLGIFLIGNILYRLWNGVEEGISRIIIGVSKDVITVAFVIVAAPYLYDVFAYIVNEVGGNLINYGNPGILIGDAIGVIASGMGLGYFVPELADLGSDLAFAIFLAFALFIIRFLAIAAILVATPILAVMWLFPPFRGAVRIFFEMILALGISGIVAAALFALLGKLATSSPIAEFGIGLASPVLFGFLPMILSFTGVSSIMTQGGFLPFGRGRKMGAQGAQTQGSQTQQPTPAAAGGAVAGAAVATAGYTKLRSPGSGALRSRSIINQPGTPEAVSVTSPRAPATGIVGRIRNREIASVSTSAENPMNVPKGYSIVSAKEYTDYGPMQLKPTDHNIRITGSDMNNVTAISSFSTERNKQGALVFPETATNLRKKDVEIKETKAHALVHGITENYKAGGIAFAQKFGQRFDSWLNQQGINIRPFESIENKIREVKLRKAGRKIKQTR
ncbi:hypothetical protein [Acidianus sp. HS-5]|uniref:hypothetical protein n=1 Tax=Acidianus sp. HS-5 TaxID=2886040 RepID=UPI001F2A7087|nr:hypothetical protein [Acidianus sp. HS-5]BDC18251.1 hypothetical protein HS5_11410 [Acidianus sp. HS-5]